MTLKSMLMASVAASGAMAMAVPAFAQAASTDEKVTVTGSRIVRKNLTSTSPVSTLSNVEIKQSGTVSAEQLLNNQPIVVPGQTGEVSNGASGIATVDLRGLGPQRTLVLINGRRVGPGDPLQPVADLNSIPVSLIQRVEVVSGGASAVYGSDALAGAVNFIMKKNFEGVQVDVQYGFSQHTNDDSVSRQRVTNGGFVNAPKDVTDAETFNASVTVGANTDDGKGNVTLFAAFTNFQELRQDQRDFSACALADDFSGGFYCLGSSNLNRITPRSGTNAATRYFINPSVDGVVGNNTLAVWGTVPGSQRFFNFAPDNFLQRPRDTYQFSAFGNYEVNRNLEFYVEASMSNDTTRGQIAASGAFAGSVVTMNCDNPLMSAAQRALLCAGLPANALLDINLGRRNIEGGPRQADLEHTQYRVVTGVRGDITDGWNYDVYAQYSKSPYSQVYRNEWSKQRVTNALQVNPLDPTKCLVDVATCVPLDIFSGIGGLTPAMLNYVTATGVINGATEEQVVSGSITGDLGTLGLQSPGSDRGVQMAAGIEYRRQAIQYDASRDFQINDLFGQGGNTPSQPLVDYDVWEAFGEIEVPLISDKPFFKLLSLNGGYRISDYEQAGINHAYKYGAEWAPTDDVRLRGSFNRSTRAPNVLELFGPVQTGLFGGADPCAGTAPFATLAQCIQAGLTTPAQQALYGTAALADCPAAQCSLVSGGNPNLKPEQSDTVTYGIVFTPTFLKGFSASVDYFDIEINNPIGAVPPNVILFSCLTANVLCSQIKRDPVTGSLSADGLGVTSINTNFGTQRTNGLDIEVNYTLDLDSAGSLALGYFGTITDEFSFKYGGVSYDCIGLYGVTCGTPFFDYRHKARATWATPWDLDLSVAWRHYSEVQSDTEQATDIFTFPLGCGPNPCGALASAKIPAYDYFDLSADWSISETYSVRFGVNNVADKNPPIIDGQNLGITSPPFGNGNTYPGVYDSLGREFFIGGTAKF